MKCGLCEKNKELRNSHIIPEFLYKPMYDEKHRAIGVHGIGKNNWQYLQKGLYEPLLCGECEQFLNQEYEEPFLSFWIDNKAIPSECVGSLFIIRSTPPIFSE